MKQTTLYVQGMHCSACELLIEKKLLTLDEVTGVDASLKDEKVVIHTEGNLKHNTDELNELVRELGYTFTRQAPSAQPKQKEFAWYYVEGKGMQFDGKVFMRKYEWFFVIIVLFIGWKIVTGFELGQYMNPDGPETILGVVVVGLIASVSSCAALIGGLLMSLTKMWHEQTLLEGRAKKSVPHVQFHAGRLIGFAMFGGALGLLGDVITLDNVGMYATLVLLVSVIMVVLSLQMLGVRFVNKLRIKMPASIAKNVLEHPKRGPFLIGAGTFFLPCGFTLIAQALALASGSFAQGALVMVLFALGTLPMLLGVSVFGLKMNSKPHRTAKFNKYAGIVVLLFALYNINGQLNVLGLPSFSDIRLLERNQAAFAEIVQNESGEQVVSIVAQGFSYVPTSRMTIKAGMRTKLVVDNKGVQGCGAFLSVFGLMDGYVPLKPGQNVIDLGAPRAGSYKITCSMGMVQPVILRVI